MSPEERRPGVRQGWGPGTAGCRFPIGTRVRLSVNPSRKAGRR